MSNIGQLFKTLGNNSTFLGYITQDKTSAEIIDQAISDETLMSELLNIVNDVSLIKSKMDIVIGQRLKSMKKVVESENIIVSISDTPDQCQDPFTLFTQKPINKDNVIFLWSTCYLERVGKTTRLVNKDIEMFY
jgi:hypothetical protein